jgi:protein TonB
MSPSAATAGLLQALAAERALFWCVLASIVLHALVLLGLSSRGAPAPPAKALSVLTARLMPLAAAPPAPLPPPKPAPPPLREPVSSPRPQREPASAPRPAPATPAVAPAPAPAPAPQTAAPADALQAPQPEPAPPAASSAAVSPAPVTAPVATRPAPVAPAAIPAINAAGKSGNEADAGTLDQYRLALIVATRRYKLYPKIALEKGWQGRVEVHMVIAANGTIASASIKSGSGHDVLDNQALDMLKKGRSAVPIPDGLRGREFSIDVPVVFNLENPSS